MLLAPGRPGSLARCALTLLVPEALHRLGSMESGRCATDKAEPRAIQSSSWGALAGVRAASGKLLS